jgi:type III secretion protein J
VLGTILVALPACSVPLAGDLDDAEANRVFVALDRANVEATKEPDPAVEGMWRISVSGDDVSHALAILREENLPRRTPLGVMDAVGKSSLVPSEAVEQAQLVAGIGGDLERSLGGIEGVLDARVHLSIPRMPLSPDAIPPHGTAGVLLEHRGPTPPITTDAVQRLVAGGVAGLLPSDVSVVMIPRPAPAIGEGVGNLAYVGPFAVARSSLTPLKATLLILITMIATLAAGVFLLRRDLRLARGQLALGAHPPRAP